MVASLAWPRSWDASVMEYIGWAIDHGARPYRDVFDMNYPGTYLFTIASQRVVGTSDLSFRIRDVVTLVVALAVVARLLRGFPRLVAPFAVVAVAGYYLVGLGPADALQRDWLIAILALASVLVLAGPRSTTRSLGAGVLLGCAVSMKPNAAVVLVAVPGAFAAGALLSAWERGGRARMRRGLPRELRRLGLVALGALAVVVVALVWVALTGGWSAFVWLHTHYLGPYSLLNGDGIEQGTRLSSLTAVTRRTFTRLEVPTFVFAALVVAVRRRPRVELRIVGVLIVLLGAGMAQAISAGKGWDYHYATWMVAGTCLLAVAAGDLSRQRWASWDAVPQWLSLLVSAGCLAAVTVLLGRAVMIQRSEGRGQAGFLLLAVSLPVAALAAGDLASALQRRLRGDHAQRRPEGRLVPGFVSAVLVVALLVPSLLMLSAAVDGGVEGTPRSEPALAAALEKRMQPGDKVQILATVGGHEAALEAEAPPATRFTYDFHFFHDEGTPVTDELRGELIEEWDQDPPEFVILYDGSWAHRSSYEDLGSFPELSDELADYRVVFATDEARLLERRDRS